MGPSSEMVYDGYVGIPSSRPILRAHGVVPSGLYPRVLAAPFTKPLWGIRLWYSFCWAVLGYPCSRHVLDVMI